MKRLIFICIVVLFASCSSTVPAKFQYNQSGLFEISNPRTSNSRFDKNFPLVSFHQHPVYLHKASGIVQPSSFKREGNLIVYQFGPEERLAVEVIEYPRKTCFRPIPKEESDITSIELEDTRWQCTMGYTVVDREFVINPICPKEVGLASNVRGEVCFEVFTTTAFAFTDTIGETRFTDTIGETRIYGPSRGSSKNTNTILDSLKTKLEEVKLKSINWKKFKKRK